MSIHATLIGLQHARKLFPYQPSETRNPPRRRIFLTAPDLDTGGFVAAGLTRFVLGERVYKSFLKRLDPPPEEIWEIRVTAPRPQWRLLGRFLEPDTLVLTGVFSRDALGRKGSAAWKAAIADCVRQWAVLFPGRSPHSATTIHDYVTENCDDFPLTPPRKRKPRQP